MEEPQPYTKSLTVGFIGGGNMASAIGGGLIKKDRLDPNKCWVSTRTDRMHNFWSQFDIHLTNNNKVVLDNCEIIFLAVKPDMLDDVFNNIRPINRYRNKLFISMLAGVTLDILHNKISVIADISNGIYSPDNSRVVRIMPNMPLLVAEGITAYCSNNATHQDLEIIKTLFCCLGMCEHVPESLINAIGGLSGCSPAFAYLIIEALSDGGVKMGIPRSMATKFAAQVLVGAGKMVLETGRHPGQLKDEVCSPGGTTIAGVHAMEVGGVRGSMINAVEAAVNKTNKLLDKTVLK